MSGFWSMRRLMTGAILATVVAGATCLLAQSGPTSGPAMPPPGVMPDPNKAIATINGKDINNAAFNNILMQVAGMRVFQQVFDLSLVQNACLNAGVPLSGEAFQQRLTEEYNRTLASLNLTYPPPTSLPGTRSADLEKKDYETAVREAALNQVLQRQGVTAVEFRIGLETRANLRALSANAKITVTPTEVSDAYDSEYGEKRSVHIFVLNEKVTAAAVRKALTDNMAKPETERKKPEEVATASNWPQPAAWTISANAKGIEDVVNVAFKTLTKPGDLSADTTVKQKDQLDQHVIIQLDSITADTKAAHLKSDKELKDMETKVKEFKENQWMNSQLAILRANAAVQINDPILKEQFDRIGKAMQQQADAAAAATQMTGTAPASMPAIPAPVRGGMTIPGPASMPR